ncbi:MAG: recombination mediator RecR [Prolixibacteraceae bacterium]|jgi:recombination protein RecR|nr:recombination mediator RecR [Prolixibacteraceae bacterium]
MSIDHFPSKLLENAVNEFSKLPGIGKKTALRLVLHLLRKDPEEVHRFSEALTQLRDEVKHCKHCHNISDGDVCNICGNHSRDQGVVCVVENIRDVMSIENTQQYRGVYHVLGGIISPMDGIGPADLEIDSLLKRVEEYGIREVIFALSTTMEGDSTNFYLFKKLKNSNIRITTLARGVSVGDELEFTDEVTLGRSIVNRLLYEQVIS